ncbi:MAG: DUF2922 domain-containing protein [Schwartzia sp.]|nr:DUF2922 domain-containing protein [Schwartzia sp. (in: firmicutes)]
MAKTLNMKVALENGRSTTVSLVQPKDEIARADVEPVMQTMIDKQAIRVKEANATEIKSAVIREVNETKLI